MKKLILIFILLTQFNYTQDLLLFDDAGYDKDAKAYFDALPNALSTTRKDTINMFIEMVKDSLGITNLSDQFDRMWILAHTTSGNAIQDLVYPASTDITIVSGMAFEVDRGFTGDGSADYLNTNYNPTTSAVVYALNNAAFGVYIRNNVAESKWDMANEANNCYIISRAAANGFQGRINQGGSLNGSNTDSRGLFINTGTGTVDEDNRSIINGVVLTTLNNAQAQLYNANFFIGAYPTGGYTTRQYAFAFIGKNLSSANALKFYNCVEWFLDAIGAGVM